MTIISHDNLGEVCEWVNVCVCMYVCVGGLKQCSHDIRMHGYSMMMLGYKGGSGGQESASKKWLHNEWISLTM